MPLSEKVAAAVKTQVDFVAPRCPWRPPPGYIRNDLRCSSQVEFYFSDSNLPRDKFLLEIIRDPLNDEQCK